MKITRKTHPPSVQGAEQKRDNRKIGNKDKFGLKDRATINPLDVKLFERIKERVKAEGIRGFDKFSRVFTEEILRTQFASRLDEKGFKHMVEKVSSTVAGDPVLSGIIRKFMAKITE